MNFIPFDEDFAFAGRPIRKHMLRNWPVEDLSILVQAGKRSAGIRADFVANAANYDAQVLDQHRQSFSQLLEGAVSEFRPGRLACSIFWLLTSAAPCCMNALASRARFLRLCLPDLFEAQVARTPGAAALVFGRSQLTYDELNQRANRLARRLIQQGVGPETIVGIAIERSPEFIVALLGVLKAGGAYLPLDPAYPLARLDFMVDDASPALVLTTVAIEPQLPGEHLPPGPRPYRRLGGGSEPGQ